MNMDKYNGTLKNRLFGSAEILIATALWGYGYVVIRNSLDSISFYALMTGRYLISSVLLLIFLGKRLRGVNRRILAEGAVLGALLYISQYFQTTALAQPDTTAGRVAFITALYVVLVPLLGCVIFHRKPGKLCIFAIFLAVPGLFLLVGTGKGGIGTGDFLALIGSVGFSAHILAVDCFTKKDDVLTLTMLQSISATLYAGIIWLLSGNSLAVNFADPRVLFPLIYLGAFSTMIGFLMQLLGQKRLPPEISAMLLSTESVFGMLFSVMLLQESLTIIQIAGCFLMLAAVLLAERE